MSNLTLAKINTEAKKVGATIRYNRATGMYHAQKGFSQSEGIQPSVSDSGKLCLTQDELQTLESYLKFYK